MVIFNRFRENRFLIFLIFSLNEAVTLKSRSRSIKIGHGNTLIPGHLLVEFGHETRKKWCKETNKETNKQRNKE
jgi:predicted transporter